MGRGGFNRQEGMKSIGKKVRGGKSINKRGKTIDKRGGESIDPPRSVRLISKRKTASFMSNPQNDRSI